MPSDWYAREENALVSLTLTLCNGGGADGKESSAAGNGPMVKSKWELVDYGDDSEERWASKLVPLTADGVSILIWVLVGFMDRKANLKWVQILKWYVYS